MKQTTHDLAQKNTGLAKRLLKFIVYYELDNEIKTHHIEPRQTEQRIDFPSVSTCGKILDIVQFTGITDINGVEIYEGDIVDYRCKSQPNKEDLRIIKFRENGFFCATGVYDINLYAIANACKLVGNIYLNPDLLR